MHIVIFAVCLLACAAGGVCGIGGGVIIKPVIDALGIMSVDSLSFLSGLTVLSMSAISVVQRRKSRLAELPTAGLLALGAVLGGVTGNALFQQLRAVVGQDDWVGMCQSIVLAGVTLLTLVYSAALRKRIPSHRVKHPAVKIFLGLMMGILSSFLGIGGGPVNLAILYFAFSMETKQAAANSLYIILFSQAASFVTTCVQGTIPEFEVIYLVVMVAAGTLGGVLGNRINQKISPSNTDRLFSALLLVIILICCYNTWQFSR